MYLNSSCQTAQNIPQFFVIFSGCPLTFFTMTNTWFFLKTYYDKITALKYKSTARRLSDMKRALAQQQRGGHAQPQRITPADAFVSSPLKATCTKLWQTMSMTIGNEPPSGNRKDLANWGEHLRVLGKIIFSSRLTASANWLRHHTAWQMNQIRGFKP